MREIKFRAWDTHLKIYSKAGFGSRTFGIFAKRVNCSRYIIEQLTGQKDKNKINIYEGDLIIDHNSAYTKRYIVSFSEGCFDTINIENKDKSIHGDELFLFPDCEVIGNIHQNPELLK